MKRLLWGVGLVLVSFAILLNVDAQTPTRAVSSATAPPSATAPHFTPRPTMTPTTTAVAVIPVLPVLKPIDVDNLEQLQPLMVVQCAVANPALSSDGVRDVLWSPGAKQLAVVQRSRVCLYDLDTANPSPLMLEAGDIWAAVFSPDGETLATLHNGTPSVRLWDTHTGAKRSTSLMAGYNFGGGNTTLAYSTDGKYIATVGFSSGLRLYDAQTEMLLVRVPISRQRGVYFSGDGTRLVTASDSAITLWTLSPGPRLHLDQTLTVKAENNRDVHPQIGGEKGSLLYYLSDEGLTVYDLTQDQQVDILSTDDGIVFLPDGTLSPLYERDPYRPLSPAFTNVGTLAFSADGTLLATIPFSQKADTFQNADVVQLWGVPQ